MIVTALCDWYRLTQLADGIHRAEHEYRMALYRADADLGPHTRCYTPEGEVAGQGYAAGGQPLRGRRVQLLDGVAVMDWAPPVWDPATLNARGFLIFNGSLPGLDAVMTYDFGRDVVSTNGPFTPRMPVPGAFSSLIQWAG